MPPQDAFVLKRTIGRYVRQMQDMRNGGFLVPFATGARLSIRQIIGDAHDQSDHFWLVVQTATRVVIVVNVKALREESSRNNPEGNSVTITHSFPSPDGEQAIVTLTVVIPANLDNPTSYTEHRVESEREMFDRCTTLRCPTRALMFCQMTTAGFVYVEMAINRNSHFCTAFEKVPYMTKMELPPSSQPSQPPFSSNTQIAVHVNQSDITRIDVGSEDVTCSIDATLKMSLKLTFPDSFILDGTANTFVSCVIEISGVGKMHLLIQAKSFYPHVARITPNPVETGGVTYQHTDPRTMLLSCILPLTLHDAVQTKNGSFENLENCNTELKVTITHVPWETRCAVYRPGESYAQSQVTQRGTQAADTQPQKPKRTLIRPGDPIPPSAVEGTVIPPSAVGESDRPHPSQPLSPSPRPAHVDPATVTKEAASKEVSGGKEVLNAASVGRTSQDPSNFSNFSTETW
jgi:hypothetical protein